MKLLVFGAVLCFTFVLVVGASNSTFEEQIKKKEEEAANYCNALYPVTEGNFFNGEENIRLPTYYF